YQRQGTGRDGHQQTFSVHSRTPEKRASVLSGSRRHSRGLTLQSRRPWLVQGSARDGSLRWGGGHLKINAVEGGLLRALFPHLDHAFHARWRVFGVWLDTDG